MFGDEQNSSLKPMRSPSLVVAAHKLFPGNYQVASLGVGWDFARYTEQMLNALPFGSRKKVFSNML